MNRSRQDPPTDPEMPADNFAVEVCLGQAWLRSCQPQGAAAPSLGTTRRVGCAWSLVLAGACLRKIWDCDAAAAEARERSGEAKQLAAARDAAKEGLTRGLLS